ncbi:NAD(P)-dependent oxidoreductase [bacterium]|nr:NAD(P)-dependent oxidoreductase [bacterium]
MKTPSSLRSPTAREPASPAGRRGLFVTGASGWLGSAVVRHAMSTGCVVAAASRQPASQPVSTTVAFDLDHDDGVLAKTLESVLSAAPAWSVIHCAGVAHLRVENPQARDRLHRVNVEGTSRLVRACALAGIERIVNVSSISVYAWPRGRPAHPVTESDPVGPETAYGKTKLAGERIVEQSGLDWRIARLATVFGPGDKANFSRLVRAIRRRRFVLPGAGEQRKSCLDIDTAARSLVALGLAENPPHRLLNMGIPRSPSLAEIAATIAGILQVPPPPGMPVAALRAGAWCGDLAARLGLPAPITSPDLDRLRAWTWVDSGRAAAMFPELERADFARGMERAAAFYGRC